MMEQTTQKKENILRRPIKFLFKWRSFTIYEMICYILMYAGVMMLAYEIRPYTIDSIRLLLLTIATLYSGFFAALIWNDITDKDIDVVVHPTRPIPEGRITQSKFFFIALVFSAMTFIFAVLISLWCLLLVGVTALFVTFHNKYLKKKVRLPAYSEIFTPVQWLTVPIFGFFAVWTVLPSSPSAEIITVSVPLLGSLFIQQTQLIPLILLVLFTYFADDAHDLTEGIHDIEGDRRLGVRTYATSFGEKNAAKISFAMFFISGIIGVILWLTTLLSLIFLIPFLIIWLYTLSQSYKFIKITDDFQRRQMGNIMGRKGYDYLLFSYSLIFLDVLIQLVNSLYLHWTTAVI